MLRKVFGTSERVVRVIDNLTQLKIISLSVLGLLVINLLLYILVIMPLSEQLGRSMIYRDNLKQDLESISTHIERDKMIISSSELPEALGILRSIYRSHSLEVEEVLISQLPDETADFAQAAIKVTVAGNKVLALQALMETQTIPRMLFLVQEINISNQKAIIDYKILYHALTVRNTPTSIIGDNGR